MTENATLSNTHSFKYVSPKATPNPVREQAHETSFLHTKPDLLAQDKVRPRPVVSCLDQGLEESRPDICMLLEGTRASDSWSIHTSYDQAGIKRDGTDTKL